MGPLVLRVDAVQMQIVFASFSANLLKEMGPNYVHCLFAFLPGGKWLLKYVLGIIIHNFSCLDSIQVNREASLLFARILAKMCLLSTI